MTENIKINDTVTVKEYKHGDSVFRNFQGRILKYYENSALIDPVLPDQKDSKVLLGGNGYIVVNLKSLMTSGMSIKGIHRLPKFEKKHTAMQSLILKYHHEGLTLKEISATAKASESYIKEVLYSNNLKPNSREELTTYEKYIKPNLAQIRRWKHDKVKLKDIASRLGIPARTFSNLAYSHEIFNVHDKR
ncbi:hypothetical protein AYR55_03770 [Loigolactobacillus backii]|uniref:hypothetical protein n=1 Tax=Loigolactobacillus backii TaxID=375175 RepID=UPI0007F066A9|nr:hypothetical protein [Loigolactobacillus backii]ANK66900.1 hypothetical protein AYR55_03770 [Loigolactobacillus backii]